MKDDQDHQSSTVQPESRDLGQHAPDLAVIRATLNGDRAAIEALIARLAQCVPRYLKAKNRRFGNPLDDASLCDLVQDVMVLVWRKRQDYGGRSPIEGWACGIAVFELFNRVRQVRREAR